MKTRAKGNSPLVGVYLNVTQSLIEVGGDDDIDRFNGSRERLVEILLLNLQLKKSAVHLVDDHDWLDTLTKSLTEDSLSLDTDTFDTVDNDKSAIGDTKSRRHFRGEIDVTG
jgi:hypothetical protein